MKQYLLFLIPALLLLQSCKKDEPFDGKATLQGTVVYRDSLAGDDHAVTNVKVRLFRGDELLLESTSGDGAFRFESLVSGDYRIASSFTANGREYTNDVPFTLSNNSEFLSDIVVVLLPEDAEVSVTLSGEATFGNLLTGSPSPAANASVRLVDASGEEVASVTVQSDGSYELTGIAPGSYTLQAELSTQPDAGGDAVVYVQSLPVTVTASDMSQDLLLQWNGDGTLLRIHVTDSIQNPLSGAETCIYNNQGFLLSNLYTCNGSQRTAATGTHGNVLFSGLSSVRYYISSTTSVGAVDLYSDSLEATPAALVPGSLNTRSIELRQQW